MLVWSLSQHAGRQQLPAGLFGLMQRLSHSQAGLLLPLERLQQAVTPEVCAELSARGYAVVDNVFGSTTVQRLKQELLSVYSQGLMHLNHTHLVSKGATKLLPKSQIQEAELTLDPTIQAAAPLIAQLNTDRTLATMLNLHVPQLRLDSQAIKMQHNEGVGGCFPMHFDSDATLDGRRVTAIIYLNDGWQPGCGGELRLYPFPAPPVDVEPLADRMCLFASTNMLHRVLPSHQPRSCFTVWLSEGERRAHSAALAGTAPIALPPRTAADAADADGSPGSSSSSRSDDDAVWQFLMQPAVRQHVCKLAYTGEWEQSIRDSHPPSPETDAALATHRAEVQRIRTALQRYSEYVQQLCEASHTLASATAAADSSSSSSGPGSTAAAAAVSEQALQQAVGVLRQAAAHVKWF